MKVTLNINKSKINSNFQFNSLSPSSSQCKDLIKKNNNKSDYNKSKNNNYKSLSLPLKSFKKKKKRRNIHKNKNKNKNKNQFKKYKQKHINNKFIHRNCFKRIPPKNQIPLHKFLVKRDTTPPPIEDINAYKHRGYSAYIDDDVDGMYNDGIITPIYLATVDDPLISIEMDRKYNNITDGDAYDNKYVINNPPKLIFGDHSSAFYCNQSILYLIMKYNDINNYCDKSLCIYKTEIFTEKHIKLIELPSHYFKICPKLALDRRNNILHLFGNKHTVYEGDKSDAFKWLTIDLNTLKCKWMYKETDEHNYNYSSIKTVTGSRKIIKAGPIPFADDVPISYFLDNHYNYNMDEDYSLLNNINSSLILNQEYPIANYRQYLYISSQSKLYRFGDYNGCSNTIHYVDITEFVSSKKSKFKWKLYRHMLLNGSSCTKLYVSAFSYLIFIFDIRGGGNGKIWICDLLWNKIWRSHKKFTSNTNYYSWNYAIKINKNNDVKFCNFIDGGRSMPKSFILNLYTLIPDELFKYYNKNIKKLIYGYCIRNQYKRNLNIPICLKQLILKYYQPFF